MKLVETVVESIRSLNSNRIRTGLTMSGVVIGISSVVLLLSLGQTMKRVIDKELISLGTNMLFVFPADLRDRTDFGGLSSPPKKLNMEVTDALKKLESVESAAPVIQADAQLSAFGQSGTVSVYGTTPEMFQIRNWLLNEGAFFGDADVKSGARVIVIGSAVAKKFFYGINPIGKFVKLNGTTFQVIGLLRGKGKQSDGANLEDLTISPISSVRLNFAKDVSNDDVQYVVLKAKLGPLTAAIDEITETLRDIHSLINGQPDDFRVLNLQSLIASGQRLAQGAIAVLALIGGISLLVGGIGIMNILLVSVRERTREIGIRAALGAKPSDILMQFLVESLIICLCGAIVGVLLAWLGAFAISTHGPIKVFLAPEGILVSVTCATVVGLFFGIYPAYVASRMLPIECLRAD